LLLHGVKLPNRRTLRAYSSPIAILT
jgi:hypothetical protein